MPRYEGRLELTWTNKDLSLLAAEDGTYEWLPPSDYRVAEVRLLSDVAEVGDAAKERADGNLLVEGDALNALTSLLKLPEFRGRFAGQVKLAYLDPPFNTLQSFMHYDALEHSVWLTMMRDRLTQVRELLASYGSVWIHLDDSEMAYCRVLLDELFGRSNFVATIVWQRRDGRPNDAIIGQMHDYIIVFAKDIARFAKVRNRGFRSEVEGTVPMTWWPFTEVGSTRNAKDEIKRLFPGVPPFATPKPERLIEPILTSGTDPGDLVLDCFAGSGTTPAVAHKLGRRWVAIERSKESIETFAASRLTKVVTGADVGGISQAAEWQGGGGYRLLRVAPSMFEEDQGMVFLADGMTNGLLAEATAAQLGFEYESEPPFAGRKGSCPLGRGGWRGAGTREPLHVSRHGRELIERAMRAVSVVVPLVLAQHLDELPLVKISIRSRHSRRIVLTHRWAYALPLGARGGLRSTSIPASANTASKLAMNFVSRSRTRNRKLSARSPIAIMKLRAC